MFSDDEIGFIEARRVAHLATADSRAVPHVVPVCFTYSEGCFWIPVDEKPKGKQRLKRLRNIDENPEVALVFDRYNEDWSRLGYVMLWGTASIVEFGLEHTGVVAGLRARYPQYRTMRLEGRPAIRVKPARAARWGDLA